MTEDREAPDPTGLSAEQAMQALGLEVARRRRVAAATRSGSRLLTVGLALGAAAGAGAWLLPPEGPLAWAPWGLGALAALVGGFGALRLLAAWQLGRS